MADAAVRVAFVAELADFKRKIAEVPGITAKEAKAATDAFRAAHRAVYGEVAREAARSAREQTRAAEETRAALARVAAEAEAVRIGPEAFRLTSALRDLDELEAKLRTVGGLTAEAQGQISARRGQLQGDLARAGSTSIGPDESYGPVFRPPKTPEMLEYEAALARLQTHTEATARGTATLSTGLSALAQQMPDVVSQLASGAPPMQVLAQQGSQVGQVMLGTAGSVGGLLSALAPLAPAIAALAIVAGTVTAAYAVWANATDEAADASGRILASIEAADAAVVQARGSVAALAKEWSAYSKATTQAAEDVQVQLGGLSGVRLEAARAEATARAGADASVRAQADLVAQLNRRITAEEQLRRSGALTMEADIESSRLLGEMRDAAKAATARLGEMRAEQDLAGLAAYSLAEAQAAEQEAADKASKAQERHRAALDATKAALDRLAEADAEYRRRTQEKAAAVSELQTIIADAARFEVGAIGEVIAARDAELARIDELEAITGRHSDAEEARRAVTEESERKLDKVMAEIEAEREDRRQRAAEAEVDRQRKIAAEMAGAASSFAGSIADSFALASRQSTEHSIEAARRQFRAYKAFAIVQATIDAIAAGARALRDHPFPLSLVVAGTAAAAGAVRVAQIAAQEPSFHQGGMAADLASDEIRTTRLTRGEGVLTSRGVDSVGGPDAVRAANRGEAPGTTSAPVAIPVLVPAGAPGRLLRTALESPDGRRLARRAASTVVGASW